MILRPLAAAAMICAIIAGGSAASAEGGTLVRTPSGPVIGKLVAAEREFAREFLGIPYAESTGGEHRWKPPVPVRPWKEPRDATEFGPVPPQDWVPPGLRMSEDCLNLNIWTPSDARSGDRFPVMVFIPGGAFEAGGNSFPLYNGSRVAATRKVIVVTVNYRLGALGFLASKQLDGNFGFLDQQEALRWVRKNIASFGGDPDAITLFGESAGAMAIALHLFSAPGSRNLFQRAIMESPAAGLPYKTLEAARTEGEIFLRFLGETCAIAARNRSWQEVLLAQDRFEEAKPGINPDLRFFLTWSPVLDDRVLSRQPFDERNAGTTKPFIIGANRSEGDLFIETYQSIFRKREFSKDAVLAWLAGHYGRHAPAIFDYYRRESGLDENGIWSAILTDHLFRSGVHALARRASRGKGWVYEFVHTPSFPVFGRAICLERGHVCHGAELPFVFRTADVENGSFTPDEDRLSHLIVDYWTNFARTGDPNSAGLPTWPAYTAADRSCLDLGLKPAVRRHASGNLEEFWMPIVKDFAR